jgi:hypothetical protein
MDVTFGGQVTVPGKKSALKKPGAINTKVPPAAGAPTADLGMDDNFDRLLDNIFSRYDFEDSGFVEDKNDVKMLAANLSFKLGAMGVANSPVTDEKLATLPQRSPGWNKADVKAWYLANFTATEAPAGAKKPPAESGAKKLARQRLKEKAASKEVELEPVPEVPSPKSPDSDAKKLARQRLKEKAAKARADGV